MKDTNETIRNAIQTALASQGKTAQELARDLGVEGTRIDRLQSGLEGGVPELLLNVLDALGLELQVKPKDHKEQTLSAMLQDNARS